MKIALLFSIVGILLVESISAQEYSFDVNIGYTSASTYDLRLLQDELISDSSFPLKKTDSFPDRPYLELGVNKADLKGNLTGLYWNYHTTGGRVALSDYSASLSSDQILSNHELGLKVRVFLKRNSSIKPFFIMKAAAVFSQLEFVDQVSIPSGESVSESLIFRSQNAILRPSLGIKLTSFKVPIVFDFSYLFQVTNFPFHVKENRDAKLQISGDNQVGPGLSGFRLGIGTEIAF